MIYGDLHCHTENSDGELTVRQVAELAAENGISVLAITDHDCIKGAEEALKLKADKSAAMPRLIYGVELSTILQGESVHILGYFRDSVSDKLGPVLDEIQRKRKERAYRMFDLIEKYTGVSLDREEIEKRTSMTRGTMINLLLDTGKYTAEQIRKDILSDTSPCYIPSTNMSPGEGIDVIHQCGGLAVLAHPCLLKRNDPLEIARLGTDGIEAFYPSPKNDPDRFLAMADGLGKFVTAGSDFHRMIGDSKDHGKIGQCRIGAERLDIFMERLYK